MRRALPALIILLGAVYPAAAASLPPREWTMLREVAATYKLSDEETWLLAAIRVQCAWAAGTIRRRYTGDLAAFGKRYNPYNAAQWSKNVSQIIARLKRHHGNNLPAPAVNVTF